MSGRVAVVGSLNCDLVMRVAHLPRAGETVSASSFATFPGGKGSNQAIAAARAGASVAMVGRVGCDAFRETLFTALDAVGVDRRCVEVDPDAATGVAQILVDDRGQNSIVVASEANGRFSASDVARASRVIEAADVVLLSLEIPLEAVDHAARLARSLGRLVVLNPAPAPASPKALDDLLEVIDFLLPNETEMRALTDIDIGGAESALLAARVLRARGARGVVVTMGARGAFAIDALGNGTEAAPFAVDVVDTTAAGDAFAGAFVAALARGDVMADALRFASAAGALACTAAGAVPSLPERTAIDELLTRGE